METVLRQASPVRNGSSLQQECLRFTLNTVGRRSFFRSKGRQEAAGLPPEGAPTRGRLTRCLHDICRISSTATGDSRSCMCSLTCFVFRKSGSSSWEHGWSGDRAWGSTKDTRRRGGERESDRLGPARTGGHIGEEAIKKPKLKMQWIPHLYLCVSYLSRGRLAILCIVPILFLCAPCREEAALGVSDVRRGCQGNEHPDVCKKAAVVLGVVFRPGRCAWGAIGMVLLLP